MNYDAFISYRRENGFYLARLVRDQLKKRGISAFLDLDELRSGEFDKKLYETINDSPNFILILPKGALDRCIHEDDWVRKEIFAAVRMKRHIIPVLGEDFEWPRELYDEMPEEIKSLEYYSGVKTSKEYLDAMIDRLISFMEEVEHPIKTQGSGGPQEGELVSPEKYFRDGIREIGNLEVVDMALHSGAEWFTSIEKNDLLYEVAEHGVRLRILLNTPDAAELLAKHMRHKRKRYMSFEECIEKWDAFQREYPANVEIRFVDIPILRRYYSFHMKDICMDTVNVKYYTYANVRPEKNYQPIFYCDSEYFKLYRDEFEYLWSRSFDSAEGRESESKREEQS